MALNSQENTQLSVIKTIRMLNFLRSKCKYLTIVWTRAHIGTEGNKRADVLAKQGGEKGVVLHVGRPKCDINNAISKLIRTRWKDQWSNYRAARMSKLFLQEINESRQSDAMRQV
jgi:hypothetical protein